MSREHLDRWCERGILGLVLAVLCFGPLATGAVRPQDFLVLQALTLGATLLWVLRLWLNPRPQFFFPPVCWAVLAFAAYAIARYFTADIEYVARFELVRVLVYALLFFIVLNNVRPETAPVFVGVLTFLAMAISFYAVYQYLTHSDRVWTFRSPYPGRAGGTYICPNHLAGFLEMLLPLAFAFALESRLKPAVKILLGYAALVMAAGIVVTLSRGGWLATGGALAGFFAVFLWRSRLRWPALLGAVAIAALGGIIFLQSPALQLRAKNILEPNKETRTLSNLRFELWRPAIQIWRDHFWFGGGPAHFDDRFRAYRPQGVQLRPEHVHNDYLETLADWGVTGAGIIAAAVSLLGFRAWRTWRAVRPQTERGGSRGNKSAFVLGASTGLFALLLHSVVDFNLHVPANAILAVTLMALLAGYQQFASERHWVAARPALRGATTFALLAAMIFLGAQGWRCGRELGHLQRAARAEDFSPAQTAAWQAAYAVEPNNSATTYALGEVQRIASMDGNPNYAAQAQQAIAWYERGMKLNPHDGNNWLRRGMCRHWLDQHAAATADFVHAEALDPNNHFIVAHVGWHHVQTGDYAAAREYFERSLRLDYVNNPIATKYLEIVNRRLQDAAARP